MRRLIIAAALLVAAIAAPAAANPITTGFIWKNGVFTLVPTSPYSSVSRAVAINDAGTVVGEYGILSLPSAFIFDGTTFTDFNVPLHTFGDPSNGNGGGGFAGGYYTDISGINNAGDIIGDFWNGRNVRQSFFYSGGTFSPTPGAPGPYGSTTNAAGDSVTTAFELVTPPGLGPYYRRTGLLDVGGVTTILDFDPSNRNLSTVPLGINSSDVVVGFIAVPEPSSISLLMSAIALLAWAGWSTRKKARSLRPH